MANKLFGSLKSNSLKKYGSFLEKVNILEEDICKLSDQELKNKTNYLFKKDIKNIWGENMKEMDEKFKIWSNAPENPQDN